MRSPFVPFCIAFAAFLAWGCRGDGPEQSVDAAPGEPDAQTEFPYPPPRTNVVAAVGTATTVDVATWNLKNFPRSIATPELVADLIASLDLDFVAVQEVENSSGFEELVARLRGYDSLLSSHTYSNGSYQKIGFIYRRDVIELSAGALLFDSDGYEFPRPALKATATVQLDGASEFDLVIIAVHLKAGFGAEDRQRRADAITLLEDHARQLVDGSGDDDVLMLGDFNEVLDDTDGEATFAPLRDASRYDVATEPLADSGRYTYVPSGSMLDHVVTTSSLAAVSDEPIVPRLDDEISDYWSVSDHLPVVLPIDPP